MDEIRLRSGSERYLLRPRLRGPRRELWGAEVIDHQRVRWLATRLLVRARPSELVSLRELPRFTNLDGHELVDAVIYELSILTGTLELARLPSSLVAGSSESEGESGESEEAPVVAETTECELLTLALACEHAGARKFKLELPDQDRRRVLAVVGAAESEGDVIEVDAKLGKSNCAEHGDQHLRVRAPGGQLQSFAAQATFEAYYGDLDIGIGDLWPWKRKPRRWVIEPQACKLHGDLGATIEVYPDIQPKVDFRMNLGSEGHLSDYAGDTAKRWNEAGAVDRRGRPRHNEWSIEAAFKIAYGSKSRDFSAKITDKLRTKGGLNLAIKRFIDRFNAWASKYLGVSIYPVLPSLSLSYSGKFVELPESGEVGTQWDMSFKADPLIGLTVRFDVLAALLKLAKLVPYTRPVATVLEKAIAWGKQNGQVVALYIEISGTIGGSIGGRKRAERARGSTNVDFRGTVEGKLVFRFKGTASFSGKFIVTWEVGAEIGGESGVWAELEAAHDDHGVYLTGDAKVLEGAVTLAYWASGSFEWQGSASSKDGKKYVLWKEIDIWDPGKAYLLES